MRLTELGKIYLDLGYLTQSMHVPRTALDIAKESNLDKPNLQVNLAGSVCSIVAVLLIFQRITAQITYYSNVRRLTFLNEMARSPK